MTQMEKRGGEKRGRGEWGEERETERRERWRERERGRRKERQG